MRKIPTLFKREFDDNHHIRKILPELSDLSLQEVLEKGEARVKWDGACCAIIHNKFYKRYDAKHGKTPPEGSIPCQPEPDPVTSHWPHWVEVNLKNPGDKWFLDAYSNSHNLTDGTYEAVGIHFQGNPYHMDKDILIKHEDSPIIPIHRTFEGIKYFLSFANMEGIVFWLDGEPRAKIKRRDFGYEWPTNWERPWEKDPNATVDSVMDSVTSMVEESVSHIKNIGNMDLPTFCSGTKDRHFTVYENCRKPVFSCKTFRDALSFVEQKESEKALQKVHVYITDVCMNSCVIEVSAGIGEPYVSKYTIGK